MLNAIITVVILILLTVGIVWLIDKFVPKKLKPILNIALWILIAFLAYITFNSVYGEIKFNELKDKRYVKVIEKLKDVRDAELAYRTVTGKFAGNFDELVKFIDTAKFTITQRKDSTVVDDDLTRRFGGVTMTKDIVVVDTLGTTSVKDSLFGADNRYKSMMDIPVGKPGTKIELKAGQLDGIAVFEASVPKSAILFDQNKNFVTKEEQVMSVDGVRGPSIKVGSMEEISIKGNWPPNLSKD